MRDLRIIQCHLCGGDLLAEVAVTGSNGMEYHDYCRDEDDSLRELEQDWESEMGEFYRNHASFPGSPFKKSVQIQVRKK